MGEFGEPRPSAARAVLACISLDSSHRVPGLHVRRWVWSLRCTLTGNICTRNSPGPRSPDTRGVCRLLVCSCARSVLVGLLIVLLFIEFCSLDLFSPHERFTETKCTQAFDHPTTDYHCAPDISPHRFSIPPRRSFPTQESPSGCCRPAALAAPTSSGWCGDRVCAYAVGPCTPWAGAHWRCLGEG